MSEVIDPSQDLGTASAHVMQCMEVWGGNHSVDTSVRLTGLDAWVYARPYQAEKQGGDVHYLSSCVTGRITRLLLADVSGHGAAVANVARSLRDLMRGHVNHLDQLSFVKQMNRAFAQQAQAGTFATALVMTYFGPQDGLTLCNAGHPPPLVYRAESQTWSYLDPDASGDAISDESLEPTNVPLGILDMADYEQMQLTLDPGDLVLCYTDSLPESRDRSGRMLGFEGLLAIVSAIDVTRADRIIPLLVQSLTTRGGGAIEGDDITILLMKPNPATSRPTLTTSLLAPFRIVISTVRRCCSFKRPPLPDLKVASILGAYVPWFERYWKK